MKYKILLVGCGNIGSRHLQSLIKLRKNIEIQIVEPNKKSQEISKKLLKNSTSKKLPKILWFEKINELNSISDLVIVATHSKGRANLILNLLKQGHKRFIIEKIVCQSKLEYEKLIASMKKFNAKSWVNTPRRYFKSYKIIKNIFKNNNIVLHVDGGNFGLGTNSIHMIDLFSWLINDYNISINGSHLNGLLPNKRGKNFVEFNGTLIGRSINGSFFSISSHKDSKIPLTVMLTDNKTKIFLNESESNLIMNSGKKKFTFKTELVSNITNQIAKDIIEKDSCMLPRLENLFVIHTELFRVFNEHLKQKQNTRHKLCPIT